MTTKSLPIVGKVHTDPYLCLHSRIGSFELPTGGEAEMAVTEPLRTPMITHPDGRTWSIGWQELCQLALDAFEADKPTPPPSGDPLSVDCPICSAAIGTPCTHKRRTKLAREQAAGGK